MRFLILISFYLGLSSSDIFAQVSIMKQVTLSAGSHTEFYNKVQSNQRGSQRKFEFNPMLGVGKIFALNNHLDFRPELLWVLPKNLTESSNTIRQIFLIRPDFRLTLPFQFGLRFATSFAILNQHGKGGKVKLNNGNTQTTFYNPDENRTSINNTLDLGLDWNLTSTSQFRLQTYTYSFFKSERRQTSYSLLYSYTWE